MIDYILTIISCSLYCFGWWTITSEGMVLYTLKLWADKWLPEIIYKPTFGCVTCFGSVHGGLMYYFITKDMLLLFPAMVSIAGLNYMIAVKYGD